jgi:hypothetical protein
MHMPASPVAQVRGTKWLQREREPDMSVAETLTALATDSSIDLLVAGSFRGKKGERLWVTLTASHRLPRVAACSAWLGRHTARPRPQ